MNRIHWPTVATWSFGPACWIAFIAWLVLR